MKEQESMRLMRAMSGIGEDMIEQAEALRPTRHRPRAWIIVAAVVGLLTLLLVTSVAAAYDVGFYISQIFGGDVQMLNEITAKPGHVSKRSTTDDVKIDVVGITGDQFSAYIWLNITLPENLDMENKSLWFSDWSASKASNIFGGPESFSSVYGLFEEIGDNVYKTYIRINSSKPLRGSRIKVQFEDVCTLGYDETTHPDNFNVEIEGTWTLSFSLNYADLTRVYTPDVDGAVLHIPADASIHLPPQYIDEAVYDIPVETCELHISPISVRMSFNVAGNEDIHPADHVRLVKIILGDGTIVEAKSGSGGGHYSPETGYSFDLTAYLSEPIFPDSVVAIEYCDVTIPVK